MANDTADRFPHRADRGYRGRFDFLSLNSKYEFICFTFLLPQEWRNTIQTGKARFSFRILFFSRNGREQAAGRETLEAGLFGQIG